MYYHIAEHKKMGNELQKSESFFYSLFEQSPFAIWISDETGTLININKAALILLNITKDDVIGTYNIFKDNIVENQGHIPLVKTVYDKGETITFELFYDSSKLNLLHLKKYASVVLHVTIYPVKNASGEIRNAIIHMTDITEQKYAVETKKEIESKFSAVFYSSPMVYTIYTMDGKLVETNPAFTKLHGYSHEEAIGKTVAELNLVKSNDQQRIRQIIDKTNGTFDNLEIETTNRDGSNSTLLLSHKIITINGISHRLGTAIDITQRKQIEISLNENQLQLKAQNEEYLAINEELEERNHDFASLNEEYVTQNEELLNAKEKADESNQRFQTIFEKSPIGITTIKSDGEIVSTNPALVKIVGGSFEQIEKINVFNLKSWQESGLLAFAKKAFKTGEEENGEFHYISFFGKECYVYCRFVPFTFQNEHYLLIMLSDITQRKQAEIEITTAKERAENSEINLQEAQRISKIGNWYLHFLNSELSWSKECYTLFEIDEQIDSENLRDEFEKKIHPDDRPALRQIQEEATKKNKGYTLEYRVTINNIIKTVLLIAEPVYDQNHLLIGYKGTLQDISEQKKIEKELINAKERAEESDRLKSAFLANMSHEIRTPMNAIIGFSEVIGNPNLDQEKRQQFTNIIKERTYDLLRIVEDILDISKIEVGQMKCIEIDFDLSELLNDLLIEYIQKAKKIKSKNAIHVKLTIPDKLKNVTIKADNQRIKQVITNLLDNALKFTDKGTIEFGCHMDSISTLLFFIKDTGIGIPENKQEIIFDRFRQADEALSGRIFGGTGLGLSIVKGIVTLMNGKIWLESRENEGTTFYFSLPLT